jgi:DNA-binding CsgD family transcriptional regulator
MTPSHHLALQAIYAAALDPGLWQFALDRIAAVRGAVRTHFLHANESHLHAERSVISGYDPEYLASWDAHFASINAWAPGMLEMPVGVPWYCERMCSYDSLNKTEFYHDWVRPQGDIIGGGAIVLDRAPGRLTIFGGNIPRSFRDRLDSDWQRDLALFGPALRHALAVNTALLGQRLEVMLAREASVSGPAAIVLIDQDGRLMFTDDGAARMIEAGGLLEARSDLRLTIADYTLNAALVQKLRPGATLTPVVRHPDGRNETVTLLPLSDSAVASLRLPPHPPGRRAHLVILIAAATSDPRPDLSRRLGLTEAEADIALRLADGQTPSEIAEARGASIHTVRNQVKSALLKTGSRRQSDLVRILERHRNSNR